MNHSASESLHITSLPVTAVFWTKKPPIGFSKTTFLVPTLVFCTFFFGLSEKKKTPLGERRRERGRMDKSAITAVHSLCVLRVAAVARGTLVCDRKRRGNARES